MSAVPTGSPRPAPLAASSPPPTLVIDPAEFQRLVAENEGMRAAGASLQQRLAVADADNLRLSAAVQAGAGGAPTTSSSSDVKAVSRGIVPSARLKGPTLSNFTGTMGFDVDSWLRSVKKQFAFHGDSAFPNDEKKVAYATLYLDGPAADWWEAEDKSEIRTWDDFVERLHERYRPRLAAEVARAQLHGLRQKGSVSQLANQILRLLAHLPNMDEEDKIFAFKQALDRPIAARVAEKNPKTLQDAMYAAVQAELYVGRAATSTSAASAWMRTGWSGRASGAATSHSVPMEVSNLNMREAEDDVESLEEKYPEAASRSSAPPSRDAHLLSMVQQAVQQTVAAMFQRRGVASGKRSPPHSSATSKPLVAGVSKADYERCRREGRCLKCKQTGHVARECTRELSLNW